MPSQANTKHTDTSHAQNRRSPHLYPSRRSQGSTYAGVPPPFALCLYPLQASWHPLHIMRTAHHSAGTQFLFLERLWNSGARLPVEDPHSHLSCESKFCPDHRTDSWQHRGCRCQQSVLLYRNTTWQSGKKTKICPCTNTHPCISRHVHGHAQRCPEEARGLQSVRNECSVLIRVKTYRLV